MTNNTITQIIQKHFSARPTDIERMTIGISNEVYKVSLPNDGQYIIRLNRDSESLRGSEKYIPLFRSLDIFVPEIIASDYSGLFVPFSYQILSLIEGDDLQNVIQTLTDEELRQIASAVADIFKRLRDLLTDGSFGTVGYSGHGAFSSWIEVILDIQQVAIDRGHQTGVMAKELENILNKVIEDNRGYFESVKSQFYYDDIAGKNVIIHEGIFAGLVDLDGVSYGDPVEAIGRIRASWYDTPHGDFYTEAVANALSLTQIQRRMIMVYALIHKISWLCENGIKFNENTSAIVNWERAKINKAKILNIYQQIQNWS